MQPFDNLFVKILCQLFHFIGFLLRNPTGSLITADISYFPEFI